MRKIFFAMTMIVMLTIVSVMPSFGGAVGGPRFGSYRLSSYRSHTFWIAFYAGQMGRIEVEGDGDTDLDLYVYDARGNRIVSDTDSTDHCLVNMRVYRTTYFRVVVVNRGEVYNDYTLSTN
jgi:hypothetical protein